MRAPLTDASGCSCSRVAWATPNAGDAKQYAETVEGWTARAEAAAARGVHKQEMLAVQVKQWPTPDASMGTGGRTGVRGAGPTGMRPDGSKVQVTLNAAVANPWPTPTAGDAKASGSAGYSTESGRSAGVTLTDATVRAWLTPGANDFKGSSHPGQRRGQLDEATENEPGAKGSLNPAWVEALMGFPAGWTLIGGPQGAVKRNTSGSRRA
jgi:hypothetical protein